MDITIEKIWNYNKATNIAVINHELSFRCGYCSISRSHPFFGKNYNEDSISNIKHKLDEVIHVSGGMSYSGNLEIIFKRDSRIPRNQWWFGFDCLEGSDKRNFELKKTIEMMSKHFQAVFRRHIENKKQRDLDFVEKQCNRISDHLSKFRYNSIDFITH